VADSGPGRRRSQRPTVWSGIVLPAVLIAAILALRVEDPLFLVRMRQDVFDQLQSLHPAPSRHQFPVRVVAIDDASLKAVGQWPWPRTVIARLIDRLAAMGARTVVFDILFANPDRTSPDQLARLPSLPAVARRALAALPSHDAALAASFSRVPVVTAFSATRALHTPDVPAQKAHFLSFGGDAREFVQAYPGAIINLPILERAASGDGAVSFEPDSDGVVRTMPLLVRIGNTLYPSLALESLRVALGLHNVGLRVAHGDATEVPGVVGVSLGRELFIPTDPGGRVRPHFGHYDPRRYISAESVLAGRVDPHNIAGDIVFVGATAKALGDVIHTPLGETVYGVDAHVQLLERLLDGDLLQRAAWNSDLLVALLLGSWALLGWVLVRLHPGWSVASGVGMMAGLFALSDWLFVAHRLLFDPVFPALAVGSLFLVMTVPRFLTIEREQRWIRNAFARYVSPNRVRYLQDNPGELALGAAYRECSFVMSDLEGFTSLMERHEPTALSALLNDYLEGMVEIAFHHEGTLDRIVGDAVAVIFSAPVTQPDHGARAVACAREMDRFARDFSAAQRARGIAFGRTRIGVNTGTVLVGNFGGRTMLDYRALGDPINVAARLETLNAQTGTHACVSESTVAACPDFSGRPVGRFVLKGKSRAVKVFEPLEAEQMQTPCVGDYIEAYRLMEAESPAAIAAFERLAARCPDDSLVEFHRQRLGAGERGSRIEMRRK